MEEKFDGEFALGGGVRDLACLIVPPQVGPLGWVTDYSCGQQGSRVECFEVVDNKEVGYYVLKQAVMGSTCARDILRC